ncbi:MAG: 4-amino-4-deoxy-L-arabinose transferase, partial [Spirochaetia bacterium]
MDLIYRRRPVWNILYGNVAGYYEEMKEYLEEECTAAGSFSAPTYGMRITRYSGTRPWKVTVYRVKR